MIIDWKASKEAWINEVRNASIPSLISDTRFPDATRLALRFEAAITRWRQSNDFRSVMNSDGTWHQDDLEDFADFYHTGCFRADDWAQNAIARYMAERNIKFSRTIAGFCYLERKHEDAVARKFATDVRGPGLFAPIAASDD